MKTHWRRVALRLYFPAREKIEAGLDDFTGICLIQWRFLGQDPGIGGPAGATSGLVTWLQREVIPGAVPIYCSIFWRVLTSSRSWLRVNRCRPGK